jgi:hypothetical protein
MVNGQWLMGSNPTGNLFRRHHQPFTINHGSCRR